MCISFLLQEYSSCTFMVFLLLHVSVCCYDFCFCLFPSWGSLETASLPCIRSVYILPSHDSTCGITLGLLLLFVVIFSFFLSAQYTRLELKCLYGTWASISSSWYMTVFVLLSLVIPGWIQLLFTRHVIFPRIHPHLTSSLINGFLAKFVVQLFFMNQISLMMTTSSLSLHAWSYILSYKEKVICFISRWHLGSKVEICCLHFWHTCNEHQGWCGHRIGFWF